MLSGRGADVRCARDVAGAVSLLDSFAPDIVLVDLRLGSESGLEVIPAALVRHADVIAMTGWVPPPELGAALALLGVAYLDKAKLPERLEEAVERASELQARAQARNIEHAVREADLRSTIDAIKNAMVSTAYLIKGNVTDAARSLDISRRTAQRELRKAEIGPRPPGRRRPKAP